MSNEQSLQEKITRQGPENPGACHTKVMPVEWRYQAE